MEAAILVDQLKKEIVTSRTASRAIGVGAFALLTALGAFVAIPLPFTPVPLTLQTFFALLSGVTLGSGAGALSQLIYLGAGAAGLPVFAGATGSLAHLLGPTGGYVAGFAVAAWLGGVLSRRLHARSLARIILVLLLCDAVILALGAAWLGAVTHLTVRQAIEMGFLPFIPGDVLKLVAAAAIHRATAHRCAEVFG